MRRALPLLLVVLSLACEPKLSDSYILVNIDKSEPERLLRFYFGGYVTPMAGDPFRAGLLLDRGGEFYLNRDSLKEHFRDGELRDENADGQIDWPELEHFIQETYYRARNLPPSIESLREEVAYSDSGWMSVDVHGAMTAARRRIFIRRTALRAALGDYRENGDRLLYPDSTTIVGEHFVSDSLAEVTVMRKRGDGFWDFFVYGSGGSLADRTTTPPKELKAPVQCVGCHFGSRLFEPEKSFPGEAEPGPHGPRAIYVRDDLRDPHAVEFFDEHKKRSDSILGLYATIFVAQLRADRRSGEISPTDAKLLDALDLN